MMDYRIGFENYKEACERHHLEPVNFHYFLINLSQDQLFAYHTHALEKRGNSNLQIYNYNESFYLKIV